MSVTCASAAPVLAGWRNWRSATGGWWPCSGSQCSPPATATAPARWLSTGGFHGHLPRGPPRQQRAAAGAGQGSQQPSCAAAGALGALAALSFLRATGQGQLAAVAVLTALYPAVTIALARLVLGERWKRAQGAGLAAAALSLAIISVGSSGS